MSQDKRNNLTPPKYASRVHEQPVPLQPSASQPPWNSSPPFTESMEEMLSSNSVDNEHHELTRLPEASPTSRDIVRGEELIIDGVIIRNEEQYSKLIRKEGILLLFLLVVFLSVLFGMTFGIFQRPMNSNILENSTAPTLSPFLSLSPDNVFDYEIYLREIAINVSGEEALNDSSSTQHKVLKIFAGEIPYLIEANIVQLNDTKRLSQRYALMIILASGNQGLPSMSHIQVQQKSPFEMSLKRIQALTAIGFHLPNTLQQK